MLESFEGFIVHCAAGSEYFVGKFPREHRPGKAWFKSEVERRIKKNAASYGHEVGQGIVDALVERALEILEGNYRTNFCEFVISLLCRMGFDGRAVLEEMHGMLGLSASSSAGGSTGSEESASACA